MFCTSPYVFCTWTPNWNLSICCYKILPRFLEVIWKTAAAKQANSLRQDKCKLSITLQRPSIRAEGEGGRAGLWGSLHHHTAGIGKGRRVRYRQLSTLPEEHKRLATIPHVYTSFNDKEESGSGRPWPAESKSPHVIRMLQRTTSSWIQISGNESQAMFRLILDTFENATFFSTFLAFR